MSFSKNATPTKLKTITDSPLRGRNHIHMLNGYTFPKGMDKFFKYMPLDRFVSSVEKGVFVFVSPDLWKDPFERMYFGTDCSDHGYRTEDIACLCVSEKSSTNEDASWKVYSENGGKAVRLSIDLTLFLDMLDVFADKNGYEVYIGKAQYGYEKREIENLYKPDSPHYGVFFPTAMERKHYLSVMTLKRSAFEYENEFRVFLVKDKIPYENDLVKVPCEYKLSSLITDIVLSPYPVLPKDKDLVHSVRARMNKLESNELKRILKDLVDCRVRQCRLYESGRKVGKV